MQLRTLGGLSLAGTSFTRPKPLLLLAFLALEGPQQRRHLAQLFYPTAANPHRSLASEISRLKKGAAGAVETDGGRVWSEIGCDAQTLLTRLDANDLDRGLKLYAGRFLDGVFLKDWSAELEEWVYSKREELAGRMREAVLTVAEREAGDGDFKTAAQRAEAAYLLSGAPEPTLDELRRLYTLLRTGESLQAVEVQKEAEGYGATLELSAEEARKSFHTATPQIGPATTDSLPVQSTRFVGRREEKEALLALLGSPDCRLVTLVGPGGIGKTRLAIEVARAQREAFADGVHFAPFAAVASPDLMIYTLAEALNVTIEGQTDARTNLLVQLRERELLLVMDNLEHLLEGVSLIAELLTAAPRIKILATSRERLDLLSEQLFEIPGLNFPHRGSEDLEAFDAVKLLMERAQRLRPGFQLTGSNAEAVARICRLVGGLPLALELAASWLRTLTLDDVATEIEKGLDVLQSGARDMPARHRSMRAVFDHSWQLLSESERAVLSKLAVFRGGFRREAAAEGLSRGLCKQPES